MDYDKSNIDKIQQLRSVLEVNLKCSEKILNFFKGKKDDHLQYAKLLASPFGSYLTLACNIHFFEAITIFYTILFPLKKEISPFNNVNLKTEQKIELDAIKRNFKTKGFQKFRHNIISHKNKEILLNPFMIILHPIDEDYSEELNTMFLRFSKWIYMTFDDLTTFANTVVITHALQKIINKFDVLSP